MTVAVSLPHKVGAFFIKWFAPLPKIPGKFHGEFIADCQLRFRHYPVVEDVKRVERRHWFWWAGLVTMTVAGWFTDNYAITLAHLFILAVSLYWIIAFSWACLRHIRFVNWIISLTGHKDFIATMAYIERYSREYAELPPARRDSLDQMISFVTKCQNCMERTLDQKGISSS